jgi:hypothetical protein
VIQPRAVPPHQLRYCTVGTDNVVTSLMAEASSFLTVTQPRILRWGASPDAARRASPTLTRTVTLSDDRIRRHAAEVSIPPTAQADGPLRTT